MMWLTEEGPRLIESPAVSCVADRIGTIQLARKHLIRKCASYSPSLVPGQMMPRLGCMPLRGIILRQISGYFNQRCAFCIFTRRSRFTCWRQFVLPPLGCTALLDNVYCWLCLIVYGMTARWRTRKTWRVLCVETEVDTRFSVTENCFHFIRQHSLQERRGHVGCLWWNYAEI